MTSSQNPYWDPRTLQAASHQAQARYGVRVLPPLVAPVGVKARPEPEAPKPQPKAPWTGSSVQACLSHTQGLGAAPLVIRLGR